jgi:hypothetical protein
MTHRRSTTQKVLLSGFSLNQTFLIGSIPKS